MADIPKSIIRLAEKDGVYLYGLLILLDGIPFAEVFAKSRKVFDANLADWKRNTLPTLARSEIRFFFTDGKTMTEITF